MKKLFLFLVVVVFLFIIGCQTETRSVDPWFESEEDVSGWEIITNTAKRWFAEEDMSQDVQYWLTPWTVGDDDDDPTPYYPDPRPDPRPYHPGPGDSDPGDKHEGTVLGPATYIDEDGNVYLYNPLDE